MTVVSSAALVDRHVVVRRRNNRGVRKIDRQRRRRQVAVAVPDRVDEHVGGVRRDVVRRRLIGVAAVRLQNERAVQPRNAGVDARRHIRRQVAARSPNPDNPAAGRKPIRTGHVVRQHARRRNRQQRAFVHIAAVHRAPSERRR